MRVDRFGRLRAQWSASSRSAARASGTDDKASSIFNASHLPAPGHCVQRRAPIERAVAHLKNWKIPSSIINGRSTRFLIPSAQPSAYIYSNRVFNNPSW
jgi:hypothetical protein